MCYLNNPQLMEQPGGVDLPEWNIHNMHPQTEMGLPPTNDKFCCLKEIPLKVNCFIWREKMWRIPVALELSKRGVYLETLTCLMCNEYEEVTDHVLVDCPYSRMVFEGVLKWCNVNTKSFHTVKDVVDFVSQWGLC